MRSSTARAWRLLALTVILRITAAPATRGQVNEQISGTVESIWGPTLVLRTNPPPPRRVTFGESARPVAPAVPTILEVDLDNAPASQWVFLRPGERIAVVGVPSADGRRFSAIRVIGGAGPSRSPETP